MTDLTDRTKDELLDLARDRDLEGRSAMTKDELIAALGPEETFEPEEEALSEQEREANARALVERENQQAAAIAPPPAKGRRRR
jgi:hypothetical protein